MDFKMHWYEYKKLDLRKCKKFLGQGNWGIAYLTEENLVVKIEQIKYDESSYVNDDFGLKIVPTLNDEIRRHFVQIFDIKFLNYNPLSEIKFPEKHNYKFKKQFKRNN